MAWTSPMSFSVGAVLTSAQLNTYVRDNENAILTNATTLNSTIVASSLTSVGTLTGLTVSAGANASTTLTVGQGGAAPSAARTARIDMDAPSQAGTVGDANLWLKRAGTGIWLFGIDATGANGAKAVDTDFFWYSTSAAAYRMALSTAGALTTAAGITAQSGNIVCTAGQIQVPTSGSGAGLLLGGDALLYRSAANTLSTGQGHWFYSDMAAGGANGYLWSEAGSWRYSVLYDGTANYWMLKTTDSDGGGTDADVIRIPDGQLTVDGNSTFDANAFDWVCSQCGWHGPERVSTCPQCHSAQVAWQDDAALMHVATRKPWQQNSEAIGRLEQLGIVKRYKDGSLFTSLNRFPWFAMSAMAQLWQRFNVLEQRLALLGGAA